MIGRSAAGQAPGPLTLGIDTSGILGGVALAQGGRLLAEIRCDARAAASERILPQVTQLLDDLGKRRQDIDRLGVALGPGSFTGLRVGLATAKGLAQGLERPVAAISSLVARAYGVGIREGPILVVSAHRRGDLFCSAGIFSGAQWRELLPEASRPVADARTWAGAAAAAAHAAAPGAPCFLTGDATPLLWDVLSKEGVTGPWLAVAGGGGAAPGAVALLAAALPEAACAAGEQIDALLPNYLRGSDARLPGAARGAVR